MPNREGALWLPARWAVLPDREAAGDARRPGRRRPARARFLHRALVMVTDLLVYVLRFEGVGPLTHAFDRVMSAPEVESCSLELHQRQLRLLAPRAVAERLVERLYLEGGLAWCTRHDFEAVPD